MDKATFGALLSDTMDDLDHSAEELPTNIPLDTTLRSGASAVATVDELPMVVWLRGDEPYYGQFTLTADDVMAQLGIRRSRLTQISGRELRVGRARRGRYVSPVFRPGDVDAYQAWTRATAAHQKSSSMLDAAARELAQRAEALSAGTRAVRTEVEAALDGRQQDLLRAIQQMQADARLGADAGRQRLAQDLQGTLGRLSRRLADIVAQGDRHADGLSGHGARLDLLIQDVAALAAHVRNLHRDLLATARHQEQLGITVDRLQAWVMAPEPLRARPLAKAPSRRPRLGPSTRPEVRVRPAPRPRRPPVTTGPALGE